MMSDLPKVVLVLLKLTPAMYGPHSWTFLSLVFKNKRASSESII